MLKTEQNKEEAVEINNGKTPVLDLRANNHISNQTGPITINKITSKVNFEVNSNRSPGKESYETRNMIARQNSELQKLRDQVASLTSQLSLSQEENRVLREQLTTLKKRNSLMVSERKKDLENCEKKWQSTVAEIERTHNRELFDYGIKSPSTPRRPNFMMPLSPRKSPTPLVDEISDKTDEIIAVSNLDDDTQDTENSSSYLSSTPRKAFVPKNRRNKPNKKKHYK